MFLLLKEKSTNQFCKAELCDIVICSIIKHGLLEKALTKYKTRSFNKSKNYIENWCKKIWKRRIDEEQHIGYSFQSDVSCSSQELHYISKDIIKVDKVN